MSDQGLGAFGVLPFELRQKIYRLLLTTTYTFKPNVTPRHYEFSPEIIRVCKSISQEASMVLYEENFFVVIRLDAGAALLCSNWFSFLPWFRHLTVDKISQPALVMDIAAPDEAPFAGIFKSQDLVASIECLEAFVECLWEIGNFAGLPNSFNAMDLKLAIHPIAHLGRRTLRRLILEPLTHIHGFRTATVSGLSDINLVESLCRSLTLGPTPEGLHRALDYFLIEAELLYRQKLYGHACTSWSKMLTYQTFVSKLINHDRMPRTDVPLALALDDSLAKVFTARLGVAKALLHKKDYTGALITIYHNLNDHMQAQMTPLTKAQFYLCISMARFAAAQVEHGEEALREAALLLVEQADRYVGWMREIAKNVWWARGSFPAESEVGFYYMCRKYWLLLDLPEGENEMKDVDVDGDSKDGGIQMVGGETAATS